MARKNPDKTISLNRRGSQSELSEEIQYIVEKIPANFAIRTTCVIAFFLIIIFLLGYLIRYPDIVSGEITISTSRPPVKLIANAFGKILLLNVKTGDEVGEGEYIALIQNAARFEDVLNVKRKLEQIKLNDSISIEQISNFPKSVSLGELGSAYFSFINACEQIVNYERYNLLKKQEDILKIILEEQKKSFIFSSNKITASSENLYLMNKLFTRDSLLLLDKIIAEANYDRTKMELLSTKDNYNNALRENITFKQQIEETLNKIQQVAIQQTEKKKQLKLDLYSTYTVLLDNIKTWEDKYVFKSPLKGKVQYLNFWANNYFISQGEPVFTIVPTKTKAIGQMMLPITGAGKVKKDQDVLIKLEDYPYEEFGYLKGHVSSISLTTNQLRTEKGNIETFLITVDLPNDLRSNHGENLEFRFEMKGKGEIITKKRTLAARLFDNLRNISKD